MLVKEILKQKHTVLSTASGYKEHQGLIDYTQVNMTLYDILYVLSNKYKEGILKLRKLEYHSDIQKKNKEEYPTWFVGGIFPFNKQYDRDILEYSNIMCVDIDKIDNMDIDIDTISKQLFELPYVFFISKSLTGQGIYVLLLVEDGRYTPEYYTYFAKLLKQKYNVNVDLKCTNIGRKRFISYDDNMMIKDDDVDIISWKLRMKIKKEEVKVEEPYVDCSKYKHNNDGLNFTHKAIKKLLDNGYSIDDINGEQKYSIWYYVACDFKHFDDGYDMFVQFSRNSSKYNDDTKVISKKWRDAKIINTQDEICRKWCGIAKNKLGSKWYRN